MSSGKIYTEGDAMKTAIEDYFGQSPKGMKTVRTPPSGETGQKTAASEPSKETPVDGTVMNGKENSTTKSKSKRPKSSKAKATTQLIESDSAPKKKISQKKSLSSKKAAKGEKSSDSVKKNEANAEKDVKAFNFPLKIKLKQKENNDKDNFIEEFSSPEGSNDKSSNELKSPQGTLLQYFSSNKSSPPVQNDSDANSKLKISRDITDFFGTPKAKQISCNSAGRTEITKESKNSEEIGEKKSKKNPTVSASKSNRKTKNKVLSLAKKNQEETVLAVPLADVARDVVDSNPEVDSSSNLKISKKSLSLVKNDVSLVESTTNTAEKETDEKHVSSKVSVAINMKKTLKVILSKSPLPKESGISSHLGVDSNTSMCKKRKRDEDNDCEISVQKKLPNSVLEDSPVQSKKRLVTSNCIDSDSGDETKRKVKTLTSADVLKSSLVMGDVITDVTSKGDDSKKMNLMNYFQKVSKEELLSKVEKIEYKVQALVHSPPTTPSKKSKRRSINSLPGGASSQSKKKGSKPKLKENLKALDAIVVDESKENDVKPITKDLPQPSNSKVDSIPASEHLVKSEKTRSSPRKKLLSHKSSDTSCVPIDAALKSKEAPLTGTLKSDAKKTSSFGKSIKSRNNLKGVCAVNSPTLPIEEGVMEKLLTSPVPQQEWKMRVCLTPVALPSTQETLLEEESDCDEIFLDRKKKKRKLGQQTSKDALPQRDSKIVTETASVQSLSPDIVFEKEIRPSVKIAPLFTRKADIHARQQFLQSGVPDQVKRVLETQLSFEDYEVENFPSRSHIQQINDKDWIWNLSSVSIPLKTDLAKEILTVPSGFSLSEMTGCQNIMEEVNGIKSASCKGPEMRPMYGLPIDVVKAILRLIKQECPDFKVVNTFKALRVKFREEEITKAAALSVLSEIQRPKRKSSNRKSLNAKDSTSMPTYRAQVWTEKYRPRSANEVVGNSESMQQLKRWLEAWRKASEDSSRPPSKDDMKRKKRRKDMIDDDEDFVVSDNSSDGSSNLPVGVAVLYGPNGSGKTCSVYALARDLGYNVLEVNASEKRNGKLILSKLSEATQSHQVQQGSSAEQGFAALFGKDSKSVKNKKHKTSLPTKSDSLLEEEKSKKMSLILFEDVDIMFEEEDEGFLSAISTLVSSSKRPVILTTTDPENSTISRFMNNTCLLLEFFCPPKYTSTWLQIVSILEGVFVAPDAVKTLVALCNGDFRRALLQMQLWVTSGGNNLPTPVMIPQHSSKPMKKGSKSSAAAVDNDMDDISDSESVNSEVHSFEPSIPANPDCVSTMLGINIETSSEVTSQRAALCTRLPFPVDLGLYWWNIPPMLSLKQIQHAPLPIVKAVCSTSGAKRLLDDSFIASFCTEDGELSDSCANSDADVMSSQEASNQETYPVEIVKTKSKEFCGSSKFYMSYCSQEEMSAVSYQMCCLSTIDIIATCSQLSPLSNVEPISSFRASVKDSLSLLQSEDDKCSHLSKLLTQDLCHWLAEGCMTETRNLLSVREPCSFNLCLPDEVELKWRCALTGTEEAVLAAVPLNMHLERRALSTDYVPTLKTMCCLERNRSIINTKRRNRFYHYLRSIGTNLTDAQLELLCCTMYD